MCLQTESAQSNSYGPRVNRSRAATLADRRLVGEWLNKDEQFAYSALLTLYALQTPLEQEKDRTIEPNLEGFNRPDAPPLGPLARKLLEQGCLSPEELEFVRRRLMKYQGQISEALTPTAIPRRPPTREEYFYTNRKGRIA
jgi:hypothetical protein